MTIILIFLAALCLWRVRLSGFHEDYCAKGPTTAIKGVFAFLIFFSHLNGYIQIPDNATNLPYCYFLVFLGQSMVAMFFFYSGYGICESLKHRSDYAGTFFFRRFLKTLLFFELAVLPMFITALFFPVNYFTGEPFPIKNYFLCWTGWVSIGNNNWFMFAILALYLLAFLCMQVQKGWMWAKMLIPTAMLWLLLYKTHPQQTFWYDTLATFPLGMLFSQIKPSMDRWMKNKGIWWTSIISITIAYLGFHHLFGVDKWGIVNCFFCMLIILLSMKIQIGNPILNWLGANAFAIYMLQRLPMNIMSLAGLNQNLLLFIPGSLILTLLLAEGFTRMTGVIEHKLFNRG